MKKAANLMCLLSVFCMFSQHVKIESGVYKSNAKGQDIKLKINEDKTYEMSFFYGKYTIEKDTIYFSNNNRADLNTNFTIKNNTNAPYSSNLLLTFKDDYIGYYASLIYIGTQKSETSPIEYKLLSDFSSKDPNNINVDKEINAELEKGKFLYMVESKADDFIVTKYNLDSNISEVIVDYNPFSYGDLKLSGYIDTITGQLLISDGKSPIIFDFEKENNLKIESNIIDAADVKNQKDWLKINGFQKESETNYLDSSYSQYEKPAYVFKHTKFSNLKEALNSTQKTTSKYLVVAFDRKNKNAKTDFDTFIKNNQENLSSYMYDNYLEEYDKFNFYLATEKDYSLLEKNNIKSDSELLFFNSQGDLIYHTSGTLIDKLYDYFNSYSSVYTELDKVSQFVQLDKMINNKKSTATQIISGLKQTLSLAGTYNDVAEPVVDVPMPPSVSKETENAVNEAAKKEVDKVDESYSSEYQEVVEGYNDYSIIKDKQNLYQLKSNNNQVQESWSKAIDFFTKSKLYDKDFVTVAKAELMNNGFSNKLFSNQDRALKETDFKLLDYLFTHYDKILENENNYEEDYNNKYYESPIVTVLNDVFYNNTNSYATPKNMQLDKIMRYYEKYYTFSNSDFVVLQNYLYAIKESGNKDELNTKYINKYDSYFNQSIKNDVNIYENLDAVFSNKGKKSYDTWENFKNSFSNLANDVAWYVVENTNDKQIIQKAIVWSETSLKITKNIHYYLDTLAQLYYKNDEKQKAISTEQEAVEYGKDSENEEEYRETLQKMKNGTY